MFPSRLLSGLGTLLMVSGCDRERKAEEANVVAPPSEIVAPVRPPAVLEPLARRDILLAVAEAQSSYAAGTNDEQQQAIDRRPFTFRIRLCETLNDDFRVSFDEETRVLRVSVKPNLTAGTLRDHGLTARNWESVEGFWVPRPWLLQAVCPVGRTSALGPESGNREGAAPPVVYSIGVAQFDAEDRAQSILRGDRAYEITRKLGEGIASGPIDLVLEGRLRSLPGGKVINCFGEGTLQPPTCVVSARFDKVRLEQPGGELLAEWSES